MIRLYFVVEGQTEEKFVERVLMPHLQTYGLDIHVLIVETSRDAYGRKRRGGGKWRQWHGDLRRLLAEQRGSIVRVTTLFDLYGLPSDFPQLDRFGGDGDTVRRAQSLEQAMAEAIDDYRFIPYLQRHEFEALVLACLDPLEDLLDAEEKPGVAALRNEIRHSTPEDVNDGPLTAPSKRLLRHIPSYRKTEHGPLVVEALGLPALRAACPRFGAWVTKLESLGTPPPPPMTVNGYLF